jgi:hypothetical protein
MALPLMAMAAVWRADAGDGGAGTAAPEPHQHRQGSRVDQRLRDVVALRKDTRLGGGEHVGATGCVGRLLGSGAKGWDFRARRATEHTAARCRWSRGRPLSRRGRAIALGLLLVLVLAGCADRPPLIKALTDLPVDATNIEVKLLDNPDLEAIDWWEVHYTTAKPKETVDTIRHLLIDTVSGAVDDANEGYGFTIGQDMVDVHEVYTTDEATTKIVVRVRTSVVDGYREQ